MLSLVSGAESCVKEQIQVCKAADVINIAPPLPTSHLAVHSVITHGLRMRVTPGITVWPEEREREGVERIAADCNACD